ncbi:hypothetical protein NP590_13550 [Methylomonas sp. SURF-2]|uniref:Nitroreductase domain-containing protein n=1 Tax=Methylomonas subterranea TaxID=2952225 RepID=A0ABT1TI67_9GAMM|nr:hypothetical protein [Methylomonas sp. SURF-2]MCQ8105135.1 hypothetical protein [Methylomonas sp. SURF-2]
MNKQLINKILEAAVQAPSGDNVQPWRFEVSDDFCRIDLYNRPELDDSYYNYQQVASYIAHGALIENIVIASGHLGCTVKINLFPDQNNANLVATIELGAAKPVDNSLYAAIFARETNRLHYQNNLLLVEDLQKFVEAIKPIEGVSAYFANDRKTIKKLAKVLTLNDRLVFERKDIHGFLFSKIRWNKKQILETRDGMPVGVLGLNTFERLFFPFLRFWWFVNFANYMGLSHIIGVKCWYNCQNVSLIGQLVVKNADCYGFIQAGRAMQRVWLEAARQGLGFQPIVGLPLLIYRAKVNALDKFSEKHRCQIDRAQKKLADLLGMDKSETLIVGFRIGSSRPQETKTLRKVVEFDS